MVKLEPYLRKIFSSIAVKVFLSFWLIAICAISATRFISLQFEQEIQLLPAHHSDVRVLNRLSKRISGKSLISVERLITQSKLFRGKEILLKELETSQIHSSEKRFINDVRTYLAKNNFTSLTSIQFPFTRVTGPTTINLSGQKFQLYLASRTRHHHFGSLIMQLPFWARIAIPLLISMVLSWLLARSLVKPLLAMQHTAAKFGDGDLSARVVSAAKRKDELGELAISFNNMAAKLAENFNVHQRLLADVSHELRSPMTRLQIALVLASRAIEQPKELNRHLNRCELEVTRLDQMICDVLSLSRLENSHQILKFEEVNLTTLVQSIIEDEQYTADEKSITINSRLATDCNIPADSHLISSAISNILSNAIKYSPSESTIEAALASNAEYATLTIVDAGIGVPNSALKQLFKPFYRVSQARDRASGGTGLGLAIAQQAITSHKGTISAQNNDSVGLTITITLPLIVPS